MENLKQTQPLPISYSETLNGDENGLTAEFPSRTIPLELAREDPEALKRIHLTEVEIS